MIWAERRAARAEKRVSRKLEDAKFFTTHLDLYSDTFEKFIKGLFVLNGASLVACFSVFGNIWREHAYATIISRLMYSCLCGLLFDVISYPLVIVFVLNTREVQSIIIHEGYGQKVLKKWRDAKRVLFLICILLAGSFSFFVFGAYYAAVDLKTTVMLPAETSR